MQTDLSPLCKALIALLASAARPMAMEEIYVHLPDAEPAALRAQLAMLVRSTVVLEVTRPVAGHVPYYRIFYHLSGSPAGAACLKTGDATFADVAGITPSHSTSRERAPSRAYELPDEMSCAVVAFNGITGRNLTEAEAWLLFQLLSDVRLFQRPGKGNEDAEESIAYATLKADAYRGTGHAAREGSAA